MTTIRDSRGTGVACFRRGMRPNPSIYSSHLPLGAGGGKLRVLYAICQIVSSTQRDLTLPDRTLLASVSSLTSTLRNLQLGHKTNQGDGRFCHAADILD